MRFHSLQIPRHFGCLAALFILGAFNCSTASAICVGSATLLKAALSIGQLQTSPYLIQIVQGTYVMDTDLIYTLNTPTTIEGGYTTNCASRTVDPANTVIDIGQAHKLFLDQPNASPQAQINMDGITLTNTAVAAYLKSGDYNPFSANDEGSIHLTHMRFTQFTGALPLEIAVYNGGSYLENIQFDHIGTAGDCGVRIFAVGGAAVEINHMTAELSNGSGFCFLDYDNATHVSVSNSILWGGASGPVIFRGGDNSSTTYSFVNDLFVNRLILGQVSIQNQLTADPLWVNPAAGNYHLQNMSPAVNSGTPIVPGGEPATDIEGHSRIIGLKPDRGAYESNVNNQSDIGVFNTLDSGPGSLRQAIIEANSTPATAKTISFNIRTNNQTPICPAVIALTSPLPAIDSSISINGYSQPQSTVNSSASGFNANICVFVKPASGTLPTGFRVLSTAGATASLKLRGIGVGGIAQPLQLLGGQSHVIAGNQFGGFSNGIDLPGAGLNAISTGVNATGSLIIGGVNLADRNVIGDAAYAGISVQSSFISAPNNCQIVNNLVGLSANGSSSLANNVGIEIGASGCSIVGNRVASNVYANLWLQGDANVVQQNLIGINILNSGFLNNAFGILVSGSGNTIGAGGNGGSITANTVRYNIAGGVVVKGNSATANSINANRIYDNGATSNGMDIDLLPTGAVPGPTPNDADDSDTGPNDLQNFPVAKGLIYTAAGSIDRPATLSAQLITLPGAYRVDAYFSNAINSLGNRGHAEVILTHTTVQVPASGRLSFSLPILVPNQSAAGVISMTATDSSGSTSEVGTALHTDSIFVDGLE